MPLRPYQSIDATGLLDLQAQGNRKVMCRAVTGYGKTPLFVWLANYHLALYPNSRVLVLEPSNILIDQTARQFHSFGVRDVYAMTASVWPSFLKGTLPDNRVIVATPLTFYNRIRKDDDVLTDWFDSNDLLIVDEAHHSEAERWEKTIQDWPGYVWGMTATPWRLNYYEGFDHIYDALYVATNEHQLMDDGYISRIVVHSPDENMLIRGGKVVAGDYQDADIMRVNDKQILVDIPVEYWERMAGKGWQTIWYCATTDHAYQVEEYLRSRGHNTGGYPLLSKKPANIKQAAWEKQKAELLDKFRAGEIEHLVNVFMAKEGVDVPNADVVMFLRPTLSLTVYRQAGGRCFRPSTQHGYAMFVDMTASWKRGSVGHLLDNYDWSLEPRAERKEGEAPTKSCNGTEGVHLCFMAQQLCNNAVMVYTDPEGSPIEPALQDINGNHILCGYEFGKVCPGCRWRPWERWGKSSDDQIRMSHVLDVVKGNEFCDLCRAGYRYPIMYELRDGWDYDSPLDHLSHVVLQQRAFKDSNNVWTLTWTNSDVDEVMHQERFLPLAGIWPVMGWVTDTEDEEWMRCARAMIYSLTFKDLEELREIGALDRVIALGFLTKEQETYWNMDGDKAFQLLRDSDGPKVVTPEQFDEGWGASTVGHLVKWFPEWGVRVGVSGNGSGYSWVVHTQLQELTVKVGRLNTLKRTFPNAEAAKRDAYLNIKAELANAL